jgi:hypothetical protein
MGTVLRTLKAVLNIRTAGCRPGDTGDWRWVLYVDF